MTYQKRGFDIKSRRAERDADVAALDAMLDANRALPRPLKPPTTRREPSPIRSAGAIELANEKRAGLVDP